MKRYSRLTKIEGQKSKRTAIYFSVLTLVMAFVLFFFGLPAIIKFAAFIASVKNSDKIKITEDKTPPAPPIITTIPKAVKETKFTIEGTAEAGTTIILNLNGTTTDSLVDDSGSFTFTIDLKNAANTFYLIAKDTAGNLSAETNKYQVKLDTTNPLLTITKPEDNSNFYGNAEKQITVEGETEPEVTLAINGNIVVVSENGKFSYNYNLSDGENTFNIKSTDEAGNQTEKNLIITYSP